MMVPLMVLRMQIFELLDRLGRSAASIGDGFVTCSNARSGGDGNDHVGVSMRALGRYDEAIELTRRAIALGKELEEPLSSVGGGDHDDDDGDTTRSVDDVVEKK